MADSNSTYKWWVAHVVVPIIVAFIGAGWIYGNFQDESTNSSQESNPERGKSNLPPQGSSETIEFADGTIYKGDILNGMPHGLGLLTHTNGESYQGGFLYGKKSGQGFLTGYDGSTYDGEFLNDRFHGKGTWIFTNGETYQGNFLNGKKSGTGFLTGYDGTTYEGEFLNDRFHGYGTWKLSNRILEGEFVNGEFVE